MEDVDMATAPGPDGPEDAFTQLIMTPHSDAWVFSDAEQLALRLYHQLHELELQRSLLEAQQSAIHAPRVSALSDDAVQEQLMIAQHEAMEAKAEYEMRNSITHNVLMMDPVLKAVHGAGQTAATEPRRLLPLITENDTLSMVHGAQTSKLASITRAISTAAQANLIANRENRELAQTMLALAEDAKAQSIHDIEDPTLRAQVDAVDKSLRESRRGKRTMKGVLSAMVVGSGINWAADAGLTELVMDDEDD